ncbi:uncharacterized protein LOC133548248 [Nerophis ophidion]|uniref:uncharacterized protein LOC133548248 n=1 Tax=Nerophis ophidion TaxID=159077 RepID=UPI002ADF5C85|nr:uncharacterized protein LOC133548248 [Nerophis ophidion]
MPKRRNSWIPASKNNSFASNTRKDAFDEDAWLELMAWEKERLRSCNGFGAEASSSTSTKGVASARSSASPGTSYCKSATDVAFSRSPAKTFLATAFHPPPPHDLSTRHTVLTSPAHCSVLPQYPPGPPRPDAVCLTITPGSDGLHQGQPHLRPLFFNIEEDFLSLVGQKLEMSQNRDRPHVTKSNLDSSLSSATKDSLMQERVSRPRPGSSGPWDASNDSSKNHAESYFSRREDRLSARKKAEEEMTRTDYKKMYEKALATNQRLKSRLETSKQELVVIQEQLQRAQQKEAKSELGSNLLETEKKLPLTPLRHCASRHPGRHPSDYQDSRSVRKKISEMEEQVKVKAEVETENQRLKDENGALIRVITKLSK